MATVSSAVVVILAFALPLLMLMTMTIVVIGVPFQVLCGQTRTRRPEAFNDLTPTGFGM